MNKRTIQQYSYRIQSFLNVFIKNLIKKIKIMDMYERLFVFGLALSIFFMLFTPLFSISPNDLIDDGLQYIFLSTSFVFIKTFLLIVGSLVLVTLYLFNLKFKTYIVESLWFQWNPYLIYFFLLAVALSWFVSMGEMTSLLGDYTTVLKLTAFYYIVQIIIILMLSLCIYMIVNKQQRHYKWHIVGYHGKTSSSRIDNNSWLFDNINHMDD